MRLTWSRREALGTFGGIALAAALPTNVGLLEATERINTSDSADTIRIGVISDVHHGLAPDAMQRLESFCEQASQRSLDFVIQLGDFCHPGASSADFISAWNSLSFPKWHVLGNHDMDRGSKREILDHWRQKSPYYRFDCKQISFIVLDANHIQQEKQFIDYDRGNYFRHPDSINFLGAEQLDWLRQELAKLQKPTVLVSHQALDRKGSVAEREEVRSLLAMHNSKSEYPVLAALCGHHHLDRHEQLDGIHYLHINSSSYHWVGTKYTKSGMAPYTDPLFAFVTIDRDGMKIEGRASSFISPTPEALGVEMQDGLAPTISDRELVLAGGDRK